MTLPQKLLSLEYTDKLKLLVYELKDIILATVAQELIPERLTHILNMRRAVPLNSKRSFTHMHTHISPHTAPAHLDYFFTLWHD